MRISLPIVAFDNESYGTLLEGYEKRLYREGTMPNSESDQVNTVFTIGQLDQGALPLMMAIPGADLSEYNFYMELDKSKLEEVFPGTEVLLKDYTFISAVKGNKALIIISHLDVYPSRSSLKVNTMELLKTYITTYDPAMKNIYTSKVSIAAKKAEYVMPVLTVEEIEAMLKSEMIDFIEEWGLNINTVQLKDDIERELLSLMLSINI